MRAATRTVLSIYAALILAISASSVSAFETKARAAFVIDQSTGTILLDKNADEPLPPASMSKLMTIYLTFEAIAQGRLDINEELSVSSHAASFGGSSMFLDTTDRVRVEDLLRGVIVLSGNDASVVLAEALSPDGSESGFARYMTERGREMGMTNSSFANSSGWPAAGHRMSMRDLALLAERIITDYPTYYPLFAETEFLFDGRVPSNSQNRNPILQMGIGADGLKTGHTQEAGYGLVGSAKQGERRIIFVVTGLNSAEARAEESAKITNWAFRQFAQKDLLRAGTKIAEAAVWMGEEESVGLTVADDISLLVPVLRSDQVSAEIVYEGPLEAPLAEGDRVGELIVTLEDLPERRFPLVTTGPVAAGGFETRLRTAATVVYSKLMSLRGSEEEPA